VKVAVFLYIRHMTREFITLILDGGGKEDTQLVWI
jgi:hypothetical protein